MIQELIDQIKVVKDQVTALKERIIDLQALPPAPDFTYAEEETESDGTSKILVVIPSTAKFIGITLRDLGFYWASRNIRIKNISKKVVGSDLHINLFLSQNAPDKSYRSKVAYYTITP